MASDVTQNLNIRTTMDDIAGRKLADLGRQGEKAGASIAGGFIKAQLALGALKRLVSGTINLVKSFTTDIAEETDALAKMARRLDVNVQTLYELGEAAGFSGSSLEGVANAIRFLQKNMAEALRTASNPYIEAFEKLGFTSEQVADLMKKDAAEAFIEIGERMSGLQTNADRVQVAMALMGRSAVEMLPLFQGGARGIRELTEEVKSLDQGATGGFAGFAEAFQDARRRLDIAIDSIKKSLGSAILPEVAGFISNLAKAIAQHRDAIVESLTTIIKAVASGLYATVKNLAIAIAKIADMVRLVSGLIGGNRTGGINDTEDAVRAFFKSVETEGAKLRAVMSGAADATRDLGDALSDLPAAEEIVVTAEQSWWSKFRVGALKGEGDKRSLSGGVREFVESVREATSPESLGTTVAQNLTSAWGQFFDTIATGAATAADAFKAMAKSILSSLAQIAAQRAFAEILNTVLQLGSTAAATAPGSGTKVDIVQNNVTVNGGWTGGQVTTTKINGGF